jgi:glycosyltransferase involved in cell wall biosynthesis
MLDHGRPCEACVPHRFHQAVLHRCKDGSLASSALLSLESSVHRAAGLYGSVRLFLCPSRFLMGKMTEGGVYPERLRLVPNFTDAVERPPKSEPGGPVVFIGRLTHQKGVDVLIDAAARLPPATSFVVVGDGPERAPLEERAVRVAPGRFRFAGRQDRGAVLDAVRGASVVVLPSRAYENQPLSVLEALALGVPVVGTDIGGIPELLEDGVTGRVVPIDDPRALASGLEDVLASPDRAMEMGRAGREHVARHYSPAAHLERLSGAYEEAVVTPPVGRAGTGRRSRS